MENHQITELAFYSTNWEHSTRSSKLEPDWGGYKEEGGGSPPRDTTSPQSTPSARRYSGAVLLPTDARGPSALATLGTHALGPGGCWEPARAGHATHQPGMGSGKVRPLSPLPMDLPSQPLAYW